MDRAFHGTAAQLVGDARTAGAADVRDEGELALAQCCAFRSIDKAAPERGQVIRGSLLIVLGDHGSSAPHRMLPQGQPEGGPRHSHLRRVVDVLAVLVELPFRTVLCIEAVAAVTAHAEEGEPRFVLERDGNVERQVLEGDLLIAQGNSHGAQKTQRGIPVVDQIRSPFAFLEGTFGADVNTDQPGLCSEPVPFRSTRPQVKSIIPPNALP